MSSSVSLSLLSDSKPLVNKETFSDTDHCARQWSFLARISRFMYSWNNLILKKDKGQGLC